MDSSIEQTIAEAAAASKEGRIHFGQVVGMLVQAGVESYHADYRAGRLTYYLPDGETFTVPVGKPQAPIEGDFDAAGVQAAIRGAQQGAVMYPEFMRLSQAAGCVSYTVWIAGRHVAYYGRKGEMHVEPFPQSA